MKSIKTVFALIVAAAVTLLAAGSFNQTTAQRRIAPRANAWAQQGNNPQASAAFAAARDLIDDAQWTKAEAAFNKYATQFPKEENIDAAMYWTAYAEYQLKKFDLCKQTIDKMLKAYEKTAWKQDAELLRAQLPGAALPKAETLAMTAEVAAISAQAVAAGLEPAMAVNTVVSQQVNQDMQERIAAAKARADERTREAQEKMQQRVIDAQERFKDKEFRFDLGMGPGKGNGFGIGNGVGIGGERLADDDPCEFKIVVLQSLTESDPARGLAAATDWLKPNSGQTPPCRRAALRVLARHGGKTATPTILGVAQSDPDIKVRQTAISLLGSTNDDSVIDPLRDFALNSPQTEITEAAMYALSQNTTPRAVNVLADIALSTKPIQLRKTAIARIADRQGEPAVDALFKIYDGTQDLDVRKSVLYALGRRKSERAGERVLAIARGNDSVELRKSAISSVGRRGGDTYIDALMALYDAERNEEIKDSILSSLGNSNDQKVISKLIAIAKNPQTPMERKRRIVTMLAGRNKNPEVIKFFEELLRQ